VEIEVNRVEYTVIIDSSMLFYKSLHAVAKQNPDVNTKHFKEGFAKKFTFEMLKIFRDFNYNIKEVVFGVDSRSSRCGKPLWRKLYQPDYKGNRKTNRDKSDIDFPALFEFYSGFLKELTVAFPFKFVEVDQCEFDDVAAVLIMDNPDKHFILISSDKDFKQLHKINKNVIQITPRNWKVMEDLDFPIELHAVIGDHGDNVHGIKKGVGEKRAMKIIESGKLENWLNENNLREKYELNLLMVDLTLIPEEFKNDIRKGLKNARIKFSKLAFMRLLYKYGLNVNYKTIEFLNNK